MYLARDIVLWEPGVQSLGRVPKGPVCKHPGAAVGERQANADGVWVSYLSAPPYSLPLQRLTYTLNPKPKTLNRPPSSNTPLLGVCLYARRRFDNAAAPLSAPSIDVRRETSFQNIPKTQMSSGQGTRKWSQEAGRSLCELLGVDLPQVNGGTHGQVRLHGFSSEHLGCASVSTHRMKPAGT